MEEQKSSLYQQLNLPPVRLIISIIVIAVLLVAFFMGWTIQFYASILFFFYSFTQKMWISVMLVGVFQTIITIPLRIMQFQRADDIKAFQEEIEDIKSQKEQYIVFKEKVVKGNKQALFYSLNFYIQVVSYLSIGRLFLSDLYTTPIKPSLLYSFVEYPQYPLQSLDFKLPYIAPTNFIDNGWGFVIIAWILIIAFKLVASKIIEQYQEKLGVKSISDLKLNPLVKNYIRLFLDYSLLLLLVSYVLIRYFPIDWQFAIFSGSIGVENVTLNSITAIATFFTVIWLNRNPIRHKLEVIAASGVGDEVVANTELRLWRETFRNAVLIGLGAFFITNQIPSAFELSIFTFEIISWTSPFTLDPLIRKYVKRGS